MQFEGNWNTIQDVIVDKVGKYAYVNGSSHDNTSTPIIMDVSLDIRTKVCRSEPGTTTPMGPRLTVKEQSGTEHTTLTRCLCSYDVRRVHMQSCCPFLLF